MTEKFYIPYPKTDSGKKQWSKRYGMNAYYAGKHYRARNADADYWHALTKACMAEQKTRRKPFENPVVITFYWNDRLDLDNHSIMGKMIVDAMKGRILRDDSRRWVQGISHFWHDKDFIQIVIEEV